MRKNGSLPVKAFSLLILFTSMFALFGAIALGSARADDFVVDDVIVSDPLSDLPAPEFDDRGRRLIWQDVGRRVWVARVDDDTGEISPLNGRGQLIDTGAAGVGQVGNTPRMSYGEEDVLIYTKEVDGVKWLAAARNPAPGVWLPELLEMGDNRLRANGTPLEHTGVARMVYNLETPEGDTVVAWRDWNDPASERTANVIAEGGRFLGDEPFVLTLGIGPNFRTQVLLIDLATGEGEFITDTLDNKINPFIWFAPEFNDWAFVVMINFTDLAVYRRVDGVWSEYNRFTIPAQDKPLLSSPEAFAHNGRSYLVAVAAEELGTGDTFPGQPIGPSEIWLAGIDPDRPFFRRLDDPTEDGQRSEPEPYLLSTGPVVYYTEERQEPPENSLLRKADTGLGPDLGYELPVSYGGAWAGLHRDNRNCNCVPFALADDFAAAAPVDLPGSQPAGGALAGDGTLLIPSRNNLQGTEAVIALDTHTGTERFRIDAADLASGLSSAPVLVDRDDNFYVSAKDLIAKYAPDGTQLWSTPLAGQTFGPQFLPNGYLVLFTWNAVGYVIDPADGTVILEQALAPGRSFPNGPACLTGGSPGTCAYVRPLAVQAKFGTIYASLTRANGRGLLQAFQYDEERNVLVNLWRNASVPFFSPIGAPVLAEDGRRVYLQSEDGFIHAVRTATASLAWSVNTGRSAGTPALVGDLLYVGGLAADGAGDVTVLRDDGPTPEVVFTTTSWLPRSFAAAGPDGRFVAALEDAATGEVVLGVIDTQAGEVLTTPWAAGAVANLSGLTVRQDGAVIVQGGGREANVVTFAPL